MHIIVVAAKHMHTQKHPKNKMQNTLLKQQLILTELGTVLSALHVLILIIFSTNQCGWYYLLLIDRWGFQGTECVQICINSKWQRLSWVLSPCLYSRHCFSLVFILTQYSHCTDEETESREIMWVIWSHTGLIYCRRHWNKGPKILDLVNFMAYMLFKSHNDYSWLPASKFYMLCVTPTFLFNFTKHGDLMVCCLP